MSVTFTNKPATSNRDLVRILIHDTTGKLSDETIDYFLSSEPSVWYAAAMCCDAIAGQQAGVSGMTVGDLSITYGGTQSNYASLAKQLRMRGSRAAVPFAGGIKITDKDTELADTDRAEHAFSVGMHDDVGSTY